MAFGLEPGKLGFKIGDVLVGLKSGTTDTPETITSDQGKLHTLGYAWNPSSLAFELTAINPDGGMAVHVTNPGGESTYSLRVDNDGAGTLYVGEAAVGSAEGASVWRIKKVLTVGALTDILWAGSGAFVSRWDLRASLSYT